MSIYVLFWLTVVLVLTLALLQSYHRRKVAVQVETGVADARKILDSTSEGIITINKAGEITQCNLAAEAMFGYKAENVIGNSFLLLLAEESQKTHRDMMSEAGSNTAGKCLEIMACRSDGERFPVSMTIKAIRENGKKAFLGVFRDLSARKLAEENSWRSQRFAEFLLQTSAVVFYTCDIKHGTKISYVSPNVKDLLGYEPEAITSSPAFWRRHVHPDECDCLQSRRISRKHGERENIEYRLKTSGGSYRWIADRRILVNDESGEPNLLVGCWTDIHDRKKTEIDLASKEERLQISLQCARLAVWDWAINSGTLKMFGRVRENLGRDEKAVRSMDDFGAMAHPEDRESLQSALKHCLVHDESLDTEYRVVWPDKSIHWVRLAGELVADGKGGPTRMVGTLNDITAKKQLRVAPVAGLQAAS